MRPRPARVVLLVALLQSLLIDCAARQTQADEPRTRVEADQRYFEGLRARGLYSLAETAGLNQLQRTTLTPAQRAELAVELSRTFAAHAAQVESDAEQQELYERSREAVLSLLEIAPDHPSRLLLIAQSLFVAAGEMELLRWRYELAPEDSLRNRAVKLAAVAVPPLEQLSETLTAELKKTARPPDAVLTPVRMRSLERHVRFHLARLRINLARFFPPQSPDRAEALNQAELALRRLAGGFHGEDITWQSQLSLIETTRLKGDFSAAARMIDALRQDAPPPAILDEAVAEQAELLLAEHKPADAADLVRTHRAPPRELNGRLTALLVQSLQQLSELMQAQEKVALADELLAEAHQLTDRLSRREPGYWLLRCRRLLSEADADRQYGPVAGPLMRTAAGHAAAGRIDQAVAAYSQAFRAAADEGSLEAAVEAGRAAAALLIRQQQYEPAAELLGEVLRATSAHPKAAELDLLRAVVLGLSWQQQPDQVHRERYTAALQSHREQFPSAPSAGEAAWLLAELEETRRQSSAAIKLYAAIPAGHPRYPAAQAAIARCGETVILRLRELQQPSTEWEAAIINRLVPSVTSILQSSSSGTLTLEQAELLLRTARLLLIRTQPDYASADPLLARLLAEPSVDDPAQAQRLTALQQTATGLRVISLAAQGQSDAAAQLIQQFAASQDRSTLPVDLLNGLNSAARTLDEPARQRTGELQLLLLSRLETPVEPARRDAFLRAKLEACELAGRSQEAAEVCLALLQTAPQDTILLKKAATLRASSSRADDQRQARDLWQRLESRLKSGSAEWQEARLHVIQLDAQQGKVDDARKLLKVTRLLSPEPATPALKAAYEDLERQLQSDGTKR